MAGDHRPRGETISQQGQAERPRIRGLPSIRRVRAAATFCDMKAYQIDRFDGIDGWSLRERETPQPAANEVVLRVRASALNYRDLLILRGRYPLPATPGVVALSDGAGEVAAVGAGVTRLAVGDRVACSYYPRWLDGRLTTEL